MILTVEKPWGKEDLIFQGHGYAVKKIFLAKSQQTSLHYHEIKHETVLMLTGTLKIFIRENNQPEKIVLLKAGEYLCISPGVIHRMQSVDEDAVYFEAQTDHLSDVIRVEDDFGRVENPS